MVNEDTHHRSPPQRADPMAGLRLVVRPLARQRSRPLTSSSSAMETPVPQSRCCQPSVRLLVTSISEHSGSLIAGLISPLRRGAPAGTTVRAGRQPFSTPTESIPTQSDPPITGCYGTDRKSVV